MLLEALSIPDFWSQSISSERQRTVYIRIGENIFEVLGFLPMKPKYIPLNFKQIQQKPNVVQSPHGNKILAIVFKTIVLDFALG